MPPRRKRETKEAKATVKNSEKISIDENEDENKEK